MTATQAPDGANIMPNGRMRALNVIAFPLATVSAVLAKGDQAANAWFDVDLASDHEEAARFVQGKWDKISGHWAGSLEELDFLRAFMGAFAE
jgi:hypothetical protein